MTRLELITETVEYYQGHPERRSKVQEVITIDKSRTLCAFFGSTSEQMCAFGRCIDPKYKGLVKDNYNTTTVSGVVGGLRKQSTLVETADDIVSPQYKGFTTEFWTLLQQLHDTDSYWEEGKLTIAGKKYVEDLQLNAINLTNDFVE